MTGEQFTDALWYLGRGTGVMAMVLLTVSVALGVAARSGEPLGPLPRFAVTAVHRSSSTIASVLLVVHVATLLFDPYAQLRVVDVVVPFLGALAPFWLGLGTLGLDLLLAVMVTSLLRVRLGARGWRAVHWLSYAAWPVALLHTLGMGTDAATGWLRALAVLCFVAVAAASVYRLTVRAEVSR
jgi:methionine sulfoxide reductase heme-binding subunit